MKTQKKFGLIWILRACVIIIIEGQILMQHDLSGGMKAFMAAGIVLLQLNDYVRHTWQVIGTRRPLYLLSIIVSIVGIDWYMYRLESFAASIFYVFPLFEIFVRSGSVQIGLLSFHALLYLFTVIIAMKSSIQDSVLPYLAIVNVIYFFRQNHLEKEKGEWLNAQLMEANAKLLAHSQDIKEMTIVRERTRIAQELHDSIGHALVAVRMHLEYAEHVLDSSPAKSREALGKAVSFSKDSMAALRQAVSVLKEDAQKNSMQLQEALNEIAQHMHMDGGLEIRLDFDHRVEQAIPDIKNGIYRTVQEAVTNGVKHGKAKRFNITVAKDGNAIRVMVDNDGSGCSDIVKSHGILGMEERIALLKGAVRFDSPPSGGFRVSAELPYVE
ncbi:sensor histidine kinase [Paenibacillus caui]|uniref:sensor histidine kinase n=1 Tax=Paenibacillus caui TaxID=2873927 RepID=UPI001CA8329A|nr:sensor histidine kinase [Paenibacillus caui]